MASRYYVALLRSTQLSTTLLILSSVTRVGAQQTVVCSQNLIKRKINNLREIARTLRSNVKRLALTFWQEKFTFCGDRSNSVILKRERILGNHNAVQSEFWRIGRVQRQLHRHARLGSPVGLRWKSPCWHKRQPVQPPQPICIRASVPRQHRPRLFAQ